MTFADDPALEAEAVEILLGMSRADTVSVVDVRRDPYSEAYRTRWGRRRERLVTPTLDACPLLGACADSLDRMAGRLDRIILPVGDGLPGQIAAARTRTCTLAEETQHLLPGAVSQLPQVLEMLLTTSQLARLVRLVEEREALASQLDFKTLQARARDLEALNDETRRAVAEL